MNPDNIALIESWRQHRQDVLECDRITQPLLKEALVAIFDGLLNLEQRIASLGGQEWKGARQVYEMQEEMLAMRYKMILFEKALREQCK